MKISRIKPPFQPISIVLENQSEADRFISIIDKIDANRNNANQAPKITASEYEIVIEISNAFTNMVGYR